MELGLFACCYAGGHISGSPFSVTVTAGSAAHARTVPAVLPSTATVGETNLSRSCAACRPFLEPLPCVVAESMRDRWCVCCRHSVRLHHSAHGRRQQPHLGTASSCFSHLQTCTRHSVCSRRVSPLLAGQLWRSERDVAQLVRRARLRHCHLHVRYRAFPSGGHSRRVSSSISFSTL